MVFSRFPLPLRVSPKVKDRVSRLVRSGRGITRIYYFLTRVYVNMKDSNNRFITVCITMPYELRESAYKAGLNISKLCRQAIASALKGGEDEN